MGLPRALIPDPCSFGLPRILTMTEAHMLCEVQQLHRSPCAIFWVVVKELKLNCYNPETKLFPTDPYHGNLN